MNYNDLFISSTDSVVGIGGPINENTLTVIYKIKKRSKKKKLIIIVGSMEQVRKFEQWTQQAELLAEKYWPGQLTIVTKDQGFRMPDCKKLRDYLLKNGPQYLTSANKTGENPLSFIRASKFFKFIPNKYNFCVGSGEPSTIIDVSDMKILRKGKLKIKESE